MARRARRTIPKRIKRQGRAAQALGERDIVVLFADVVGCSEISNHAGHAGYNEFITRFQVCFKDVCTHYKREEYDESEYPFFQVDTRGDEGCLKIFVSKRDDLSRDIDVALNIALDLKRKWLFQRYNRERINRGLLPVDIAIGINAGKVWVNKETDERGRPRYRPEGYALNLTKRIEGESRGGKFTHILLSESARGQLYNLKDEPAYRFDVPFSITPKGIARDIKVFEVKHHFLPTDWTDMPSEVSMIYGELDNRKVEVARKAYEINPMNLWLAEEYVLLDIMNEYRRLCEQGKEEDTGATKKAYARALETARQIANSNLRDAGVLGLLGFILGEREEYEEEQKIYRRALKVDDQDWLLHWYLAYSISCELDDRRRRKSGGAARVGTFYHAAGNRARIRAALEAYERALELMPNNPWIIYDYACELSWWSKADREQYRKKAIDMLVRAFLLNSETRKVAPNEPYLKPIIDDRRVRQHLDASLGTD
ncbi:MAG: adenylate/guanylate cyclase domain-containing protein [Planctomycetota bacterium]|jgi:class 3 adenylate cyclase